MLKPGDLIRDTADGDFGLVISEVRSYGTVEGPDGQYVLGKWNSMSTTQRLIVSAVARGWVEVVDETEETTNR